MNPSTVMKISSKVDVAKITYTVGGVMLLIIMFLYIKKKIQESKEEDKNKEYLKQIHINFGYDIEPVSELLFTDISELYAGDKLLHNHRFTTEQGYLWHSTL